MTCNYYFGCIFKITQNRKDDNMPYSEDLDKIWDLVRGTLKEDMPESSVNLWFGDVRIESLENNVAVLTMKSELKYTIIKNNRYDQLIAHHFSELFGTEITVDLRFVGEHLDSMTLMSRLEGLGKMNEANRRGDVKPNNHPIGGTLPPYNFEYTFDNFIVGNSNKFAHAACTAVAQYPARDYNPLFIYGPSGLGKTHLLYAITNEVKKKKPDVSIIYIKGEDFTNQMIESLARQEMKEFRNKYRSCDMLLIDDIQFIAGKVSTQEEFFHTFNSLYEEHKQIILTSDRPPREIKTLEDRLKTRFEWGLIADIQPPDLELRTAIIKKKAEQVGIVISDEVLTYLAENLRSNIRQIEGAIKKLAALSFLSGREISIETAESCISELLGGAEPTSVTVDRIFAAVTKKYGIKREDIVGQKRNKEIAQARHICNYLIRSITDMSLQNIGKIFNRHYSTVISSVDFVEKKIVTDPLFALEIKNLKKEITGSDGD